MNRVTFVALKASLVLMILLLLVAQTVALPVTAAGWARAFPEFAVLQVPCLIIAIAFTVCVQVVLVCIWRLLDLFTTEGSFSDRAFRYIDVIIASIVIADLLIVVAAVLLLATGAANPSTLLLGLFGIVVGGGLALLVRVLRGLLRRALDLQHDLSEVV